MRLLLLLVFTQQLLVAQESPEKIKIKKEDYSIYFFQKDIKSDTISKTSANLFVLKIGISRRCNALIEIDNGRLVPTKNDSIYQLVYMPNINYRHRFRDSAIVTEPPKNKLSPAKKSTVSPCSVFKTEVNGSGNSGLTKQISIRIKNNANDSLYLSNKYYYR
jgi:hypothetical protein